jgi:hypothetical protein
MDDDGVHHPEEERSLINIYEGFWSNALSSLDAMVNQPD